MTRSTINDVANLAHVSKTTVSRFLNGKWENMSLDTRNRILLAVKELDYKPNAIARSLANQRTNTVGLLISDVGNPFYSEVLRGIEKIGLERGYRVLLCNTDYDVNRGLSFIESLIHGQVDGVLLMTSQMDENMIHHFIDEGIPTVLWESPLDSPLAVGLLRADYQTGIDQAIDLLVEQGHQRIAHISGTPGLPSPTTTARVDAYKSAMARHKLSKYEVIEAGNFKLEGGKIAMHRLLAYPNRPTAVLAANDLTAIGALQAVKENGLRIPADISLIGLDDVNLTTLVDPPLTTVALPRFEIGQTAMTILLDRLENPSKQCETLKHVFTTRLVLRDSVAPPAM